MTKYEQAIERARWLRIDHDPKWKTIPVANVGAVISSKVKEKKDKPVVQTPAGQKKCTGCDEIKPLKMFSICSRLVSGYRSKCKSCDSTEAKVRYLRSKKLGVNS